MDARGSQRIPLTVNLPTMNRLALSIIALGSLVATAAAQPVTNPGGGSGSAAPTPTPVVTDKAATGTQLPAVGETLQLNGAPAWPQKIEWLYDIPSFKDATGKVVVHWFCSPKVPACVDDLARLVNTKEASNRFYVVAYINGTKAQAKKLDPIRESEGVGKGTLAFGANVGKIFKMMKIVGPVSVIVDVDGKVSQVTTGSSPAELDARDAQITKLSAAIKEYTVAAKGPKIAKPQEKFNLELSVKLAGWLKYNTKTPREYKVMLPKEIVCNASTLKGDQVAIVDQTLTGAVTCSGPRGVYEIRGNLSFGYDTPSGGAGLGTESTNFKFEIK
jgi:hypothetical protein